MDCLYSHPHVRPSARRDDKSPWALEVTLLVAPGALCMTKARATHSGSGLRATQGSPQTPARHSTHHDRPERHTASSFGGKRAKPESVRQWARRYGLATTPGPDGRLLYDRAEVVQKLSERMEGMA